MLKQFIEMIKENGYNVEITRFSDSGIIEVSKDGNKRGNFMAYDFTDEDCMRVIEKTITEMQKI